MASLKDWAIFNLWLIAKLLRKLQDKQSYRLATVTIFISFALKAV